MHQANQNIQYLEFHAQLCLTSSLLFRCRDQLCSKLPPSRTMKQIVVSISPNARCRMIWVAVKSYGMVHLVAKNNPCFLQTDRNASFIILIYPFSSPSSFYDKMIIISLINFALFPHKRHFGKQRATFYKLFHNPCHRILPTWLWNRSFCYRYKFYLQNILNTNF